MKNVMSYNNYAGTVEYSEDDGILFGRIVGIEDVISYEGESVATLRQSFHDAVDDYLTHCQSIGKKPNRPYSGKFVLCLPPALHARLAAQAQAVGKSLNQYAVDILANA